MSLTITKTECTKQFEYIGTAFKLSGSATFSSENELINLNGNINSLEDNYLGNISVGNGLRVYMNDISVDIIDVVSSGIKSLITELTNE